MTLNDVTVIVPTRNEAHNLPMFLRSLPEGIPLVVVDNSDDASPVIVRAMRPHHSQVICRPGNVSQARQIGAEAATTHWLLFTDADVTFGLTYFHRLSQRSVGDAVYGPKLSPFIFADYYRRVAQGQRWSHRLGIPAVSGSNLLVKREALMAVGGFDPDLSCNEDSELGWRLKRHGYRIDFAPDLIVFAQDHRRLRQGVWRKTWHTLARTVLLYFNLLPPHWRRHDWGYWSNSTPTALRSQTDGYQR